MDTDPRFQLNPKFLTEVKRNMRADYGVVLTEDIGVPRVSAHMHRIRHTSSRANLTWYMQCVSTHSSACTCSEFAGAYAEKFKLQSYLQKCDAGRIRIAQFVLRSPCILLLQ